MFENEDGFEYETFYDEDVDLEVDEYDEELREPEEDDITTEDDIHFYQYHKLAFKLTEDEDRNEGIKRELDKMQFWPNVWSISDHGNASLINYWEE